MQLGFKQLFFPNKHNDQMLTEGFLDNQQYNRTVIIVSQNSSVQLLF